MSRGYERFAGGAAIAAATVTLGYTVAFVLVARGAARGAVALLALLLLVTGLLTLAVDVALYGRLRQTDQGFALLGLLLGVAGSIGAAVHGGFDLARVFPTFHPGRGPANAVDPRGLLTFGVAALSVAAFSWLIRRGGLLPRGLGVLGFVLAALMLVLYVGRLLILDPRHPLLFGAAALTGLAATPAWYLWLGLALRRG